MNSIPAAKLPDCETKNILYQNVSQHNTGRKSESGLTSTGAVPSDTCTVTPTLTQLILYAEVRKQACTGKNQQAVCEVVDNILQRSSNFFKSKNTLARVLQILRVKEKQTFSELQEKAELTIFSAYQQQVDNYIQNFRGSGFYTWKADRVTYVRGREERRRGC